MNIDQQRREAIARMTSEGYQKPQAERMALLLYPEPQSETIAEPQAPEQPKAPEPVTVPAEAPEEGKAEEGKAEEVQAEEVKAEENGQAEPSQREIRAWARSKGIEVNPRGSVSAEVRTAYEKAHRPRSTRRARASKS